MESALITSPPRIRARATPRSDFPAAVGPTTAITRFFTLPVSQTSAAASIRQRAGGPDWRGGFPAARVSFGRKGYVRRLALSTAIAGQNADGRRPGRVSFEEG